jgi:hypothetical protein
MPGDDVAGAAASERTKRMTDQRRAAIRQP